MCISTPDIKKKVQMVQQGKKTQGRSDSMGVSTETAPPITHQALRPRSQRSSSIVTGMSK